MPSPITVNIRLKTYLIKYLENKYGKQPLEFPKKDRYGSIIPHLLRKPYASENQFENYGEENLTIVLPWCEEKNVLYHNFMPSSSQSMFEDIIYKAFRVEFHDFMNEAYNCRVGIQEAVLVFMDLNGLDPRVSDMLIKERQRYMDNQRLAKWRKRKSRQLTEKFVSEETD
jgi:hypothetical protein